jgi:aminoglycoside phosphotransferase family enzyme
MSTWGVTPLTVCAGALAIGGAGAVADWLVVMRRLDDRRTLEHTLLEGRLERPQLNWLVATLVQFYRRAQPVLTSASSHLCEWSRNLRANRHVLLDPRFNLPTALVRRVDRMQRRFLAERGAILVARVQRRRIIDGHGDLRPEHIWLDHRIRIIDCLEFNPRLRAVDPIDEIAFLDVECERLGAAPVGTLIARCVVRDLNDDAPAELYRFYRCYRATLRARLAIAHLSEPRCPNVREMAPHCARLSRRSCPRCHAP